MSKTSTTGTLKHGLKIGDQVHKEFEFRPEVTAGDYFAAEDEAGGNGTLRFKAALVARQLVRIGSFTGPFSSAVLGKLKPTDLAKLYGVRDALEDEGNAEPSGEPTSSPEKP
jgi:phage FluMu protein gp41